PLRNSSRRRSTTKTQCRQPSRQFAFTQRLVRYARRCAMSMEFTKNRRSNLTKTTPKLMQRLILLAVTLLGLTVLNVAGGQGRPATAADDHAVIQRRRL